jgi:S-methylmethionine-dependent homocysteine/selenocysteine methylase
MNRYQDLMDRIAAGEKILIDGATGTEIEHRGVPQLENAWNGGGALSHPDIVRQVHTDYIREGAEIVISNTFATSRHALHDAGEGDRFESYNRRGVELACEARTQMNAPGVLVAGGISYWSWSGDHPSLDELLQSVRIQAQTMANAGVDLFMLEMMIDIDRMLVTLEAAQSVNLPIWAGLTCEPINGEICLRNGDKLVDAVDELMQRDVPLISIMHTNVEYIDGCLDVLDQHWPRHAGIYAHTGEYDNGYRLADTVMSVEDYAQHVQSWLQRDVQLVGGCCGFGVAHIAALREIVIANNLTR